jgi:hypothetical protein
MNPMRRRVGKDGFGVVYRMAIPSPSHCRTMLRKCIEMQILPVPNLLHAAHVEGRRTTEVTKRIVQEKLIQIEG